jgi:hypothetical protein
MAKPSITAKIHQALDRQADFAAEVALDFKIGFHHFPNFCDLRIRQVIRAQAFFEAGRGANLLRPGVPNSINVSERYFYTLVSGKVDPCNSRHELTLPLLMLRIFADDANNSLALKNLAFVADSLH